MRHLELHIKTQPGVFLHSWVNWSLSLMLCMSLKWQMPRFSKVNAKLVKHKSQNARMKHVATLMSEFIYGTQKKRVISAQALLKSVQINLANAEYHF